MAKTLQDNFHLAAGKPLDDKYLNGVLPWASVAAVNAAIPITERYLGMPVLIGTADYWYRDSIADVGLILKSLDAITAFTDLTDVPSSYIGHGLKHVRVNAGATGLEFVTFDPVVDFTDLGDVPGTYVGQALKSVRVNAGATALEFFTPTIYDDFLDLVDTPNSYAGQAGKYVIVNATADALEFATMLNLTVIKSVSATTYTFLESDHNKFVMFTAALGCLATIPVGLSTGWKVAAYRAAAAGELEIESDGTLQSVGTTLTFEKTGVSILHTGSDIHVGLGGFGAGGVAAFTQLSDVPTSYVGQSNKFVAVNTAETALEFITSTTATAALNVFTSGLKGLVPASGGGTAKILRPDGTWATSIEIPYSVTEQTFFTRLYDNSVPANKVELLFDSAAGDLEGSFFGYNSATQFAGLTVTGAGNAILTGSNGTDSISFEFQGGVDPYATLVGPNGINLQFNGPGGETVGGIFGMEWAVNQWLVTAQEFIVQIPDSSMSFNFSEGENLISMSNVAGQLLLDGVSGTIQLSTPSSSGVLVEYAGGPTTDLNTISSQGILPRDLVEDYVRSRQFKRSVRVASTVNIADLNNAGASIDGVTVGIETRVLLKDQSTASQNGIYQVVSLAPTVLNRIEITATMYEGLYTNSLILIDEGTANAGKAFRLATTGAITIGSTALSFVEFGASSAVRVLETDVTTTGNVGAGEDTLFTYSLPAGTMAVNGDSISGKIAGTFAASVNTKRLRLKFGGTTILDTGVLALTSFTAWVVDYQIIRTGAATQKANVKFSLPTVFSGTDVEYTTPAETLSGAVDLVLTGEATSDNDIVYESLKVMFEPA